MRALLQRVKEASVSVAGEVKGQIGAGLLIFLGVEEADTPADIEWLSAKISRLRIFSDAAGQMNHSVMDTGGELLVISQFTLFGSTKKGNRPGFTRAAKPPTAIPLYEAFVARLAKDTGIAVATGEFGADMQVQLLNDGPVTIWIDTQAKE